MHRSRLLIRACGMALTGLIPALGLACAQEAAPETEARTAQASDLGYRFDRPDAAYRLPKDLNEVSGLTPLEGGRLGAIQDEDGKLFVLDAETGEVESERKFAKDGDYEGVESAGGRVYALRSDGALFEIEDGQAEELDAEKHELDLPKGCDAEGLAYDAAGERLLIACKEQAGTGMKGQRAIYAFDLASGTLVEEPAFVIDADVVGERARGDESALSRSARRFFGSAFGLSGFKPSGLAQHPQTGRLYVLSTRPSALAVLEPDGSLLDVRLLPDLLGQPEGIAFMPGGDLFIASEATEGRAWLLKFMYVGEEGRERGAFQTG